MKYIKIILVILISMLLTSAAKGRIYKTEIYLADKSSLSLSPVRQAIYASCPGDLCKKTLDRLILNQGIAGTLSVVPPDVKISVVGSSAYVDFSGHPDFNNDHNRELLTIYSLVNSLTSSGDIITVKFTLNGKTVKDFGGKVNMTEAFVPDYDICS